MFPTDPTGELTRQRIADLHAQANRQRLARALPSPPHRGAAAVRQLATAVALVAVPAAIVVVETAGRLAR
jgi:hypothetical protein